MIITYSSKPSYMNFRMIRIPKVFFAKFWSQKTWSGGTILILSILYKTIVAHFINSIARNLKIVGGKIVWWQVFLIMGGKKVFTIYGWQKLFCPFLESLRYYGPPCPSFFSSDQKWSSYRPSKWCSFCRRIRYTLNFCPFLESLKFYRPPCQSFIEF